MATLQGSWIWYELMTPDPDGARAFYEAVTGWNMQSSHEDMPDYSFIANADGGMTGGMFRLTPEMTKGGAQAGWFGYIGVDDCDAAVDAVIASGGSCVMPAEDIPMAGRIALVRDCCGAPYYIMTPAPSDGEGESTAFSPTLTGRCAWNQLQAADQPRAVEFYTSLYGWGLPEPMDMGPFGSYQFITHDEVPIGAIMPKMPEAPASCWTHYFRVPAIVAARDAVIAAGGTIMQQPQSVPGGDWIIEGVDPQGAYFALVAGSE